MISPNPELTPQEILPEILAAEYWQQLAERLINYIAATDCMRIRLSSGQCMGGHSCSLTLDGVMTTGQNHP